MRATEWRRGLLWLIESEDISSSQILRELQKHLPLEICTIIQEWIWNLGISYNFTQRNLFICQKAVKRWYPSQKVRIFSFHCSFPFPTNAHMHFRVSCLQYKFWLCEVTFYSQGTEDPHIRLYCLKSSNNSLLLQNTLCALCMVLINREILWPGSEKLNLPFMIDQSCLTTRPWIWMEGTEGKKLGKNKAGRKKVKKTWLNCISYSRFGYDVVLTYLRSQTLTCQSVVFSVCSLTISRGTLNHPVIIQVTMMMNISQNSCFHAYK